MSNMNTYKNSPENIECPFCKSKSVKVIIEKRSEDYDLFSGIIGTICLGPIGLLCGLCSADGESERVTCICNDCGKRFLND